VVTGALNSLLFSYNWVQEAGGITPQDAAAALVDMFDAFCFDQGVCRMVGELIPYASTTSPTSRWLPCDGASVLRADFPDLFTVIGTTFGSVDSAHFNVPDLRGRVVVGVGSGSGLTTYSEGDTGGEETHTLTTAETPSHSHTDLGHTHVEGVAAPNVTTIGAGAPQPTAVPAPGLTGSGSANITSTGGDGAHENRQPYIAISWYIAALP